MTNLVQVADTLCLSDKLLLYYIFLLTLLLIGISKNNWLYSKCGCNHTLIDWCLKPILPVFIIIYCFIIKQEEKSNIFPN